MTINKRHTAAIIVAQIGASLAWNVPNLPVHIALLMVSALIAFAILDYEATP